MLGYGSLLDLVSSGRIQGVSPTGLADSCLEAMVWHLRHCPQPSKLVTALLTLSSLSPPCLPTWVLIGSPAYVSFRAPL